MPGKLDFDLLTPGNTKIGNIFNWSIPAITCCPGRSRYCESVCYACNGFYHMTNVKQALARRLELTKRPTEFVQRMVEEIERRKVKTVRVHVAGDFYSLAYIQSWFRIIGQCPDTLFYAYTRSWNVPRLWPRLEELSASMSNFVLWLSDDFTLPQPPTTPHTRIAYLSRSDDDVPDYPVQLVFREDTSTVAKFLGPYGALVCPVEQGIERKVQITCEKCGVCFRKGTYAKAATTPTETAGAGRNLEGKALLLQCSG